MNPVEKSEKADTSPDPVFFLSALRGQIVPRLQFTPENFRGLALVHVTMHCHWRSAIQSGVSSTGNTFHFASRSFGPPFSLN